jgi:type I restriction-modification system DNA methylase subunit
LSEPALNAPPWHLPASRKRLKLPRPRPRNEQRKWQQPGRIEAWNFCNVLRDDGLSYKDYLEQLVTLLFLKMADERTELTGAENPIPAGYRWSDLAAPAMEGALLEEHYRKTLIELGKSGGMLGIIFRKAQNKIQDPANSAS